MCQRDDPRGHGVTFYVHVSRRASVGSPRASGGVSASARGNEGASDSVEASIISVRTECVNADGIPKSFFPGTSLA